MKYISTHILFSLALAICSLALFSADTQAATLIVTTTADSGAGSLRYAVDSANLTSADDTIEFSIPNCSGNTVCTIFLTSGELAAKAVSSSGRLTIVNTTGANRLVISGSNQSRVFNVHYLGDLTINGITVTGGNATGFSDRGNADGAGGGIYKYYGANLTVLNSTVSGNTAPVSGGGIYSYNYFNGILKIVNSTISGNTATFGGGVFTAYGTATLTNSTISGNTATTLGGGLYNGASSTINLTNVTVTGNRSINGIGNDCTGGVYNTRDQSTGVWSAVNMVNTIVAGNTVVVAAGSPDFYGEVSAASLNNIIGNNRNTTGVTNGVNGNQVGMGATLDALLAPLVENGGGTSTHALLASSPASDRGNNCVTSFSGCNGTGSALATDQRGGSFARQLGNSVDVGAFESSQTSQPSGYDMSGTVFYGTLPVGQGAKYVSGVAVSAVGANSVSAMTDTTGFYMLRNLVTGSQYTVTPSKRDQVNGVTSLDATLILREVASAGSGNFTPNQRKAADINGSGSITAIDATQVLRYVAAGAPTQTSGVAGNWMFIAAPRSEASFSNSVTGENYDGFVIGDVNGSWVPPTSFAGEESAVEIGDTDKFASLAKSKNYVRLSMPEIAVSEGEDTVTIPVTINNNTGAVISSFSFDITFDPQVLQLEAFDLDVASDFVGCTIVTDTATPGRIGFAASCPTTGVTALETQIPLQFKVVGAKDSGGERSTALTFSQTPIFEDNEGRLLAQTKIFGRLSIAGDVEGINLKNGK